MPHKLCKLSARSAQRFGGHSIKLMGGRIDPPPLHGRGLIGLKNWTLSLLKIMPRYGRDQGCGVVKHLDGSSSGSGPKNMSCVLHTNSVSGYRNGGSEMPHPAHPMWIKLEDLLAPSMEKIIRRWRGGESERDVFGSAPDERGMLFAQKYIF